MLKECYGEAAIGFVQVKRVGWRYNLICAMCPEHKIRSKSYKVELQVNSEEPTCTERIAYWKKSALSLAVASKVYNWKYFYFFGKLFTNINLCFISLLLMSYVLRKEDE